MAAEDGTLIVCLFERADGDSVKFVCAHARTPVGQGARSLALRFSALCRPLVSKSFVSGHKSVLGRMQEVLVIARPAEAGVVSMWGRGVGGIVFGVIKVAAAHLCDRIFSRQRGKVGKENA